MKYQKKIREWYNWNRTFDLFASFIDDIVKEIIGKMTFIEIFNFSKINKHYNAYCKQLLVIYELYYKSFIRNKYKYYGDYINDYPKIKKVHMKTKKIMQLIEHEKEISGSYPLLYLAVDDQKPADYIAYNIAGAYDFFKLLLDIDKLLLTYFFERNNFVVQKFSVQVNIYDVLFEHYYYSCYFIQDAQNIPFSKKRLINILPNLKDDRRRIAQLRLDFLNS